MRRNWGPARLSTTSWWSLEDGGLSSSGVADRRYVGDNIVFAKILDLEDRDTVFNLVYEDIKSGRTYAKRFTLGGFTRDRRYELG